MPPSKDAVVPEATASPATALPADATPLMRELSRLSKAQQVRPRGFKTSVFGEVVAAALRSTEVGFASLPSLLPICDRVAIDGDDEEERGNEGDRLPPTTYYALHHFLTLEFDLCRFGVQAGDTVGVVLPNGPELAVAVLACMSYVACAPINASNTHEETRQELLDVGAKAVLLRCAEESEKELASQLAASGIAPIVVTTGGSIGLFRMEPYSPAAMTRTGARSHKAAAAHPDSDIPGENAHVIDVEPIERLPFNPPSAVCLKLRTSGSTGLKKLVPTRLEDLVVAACCTSTLAGLSANDVGINVLPMFHVGGIHRNLLAPLLAGSHMVFMAYFEPHRFWTLFQAKRATWYHGVPSIHTAIVDALLPAVDTPSSSLSKNPSAVQNGANDRIANARYNFLEKGVAMRFVSNAGAALPHAQALELQSIFDTAVLPCYGMSECAAVAAPDISYRLEKPGSVGRPIGPTVRIAGPNGESMLLGEAGEIQVRGPPSFPGYIALASGKLQALGEGEWFSTGDMGKLDSDGFLFVTGRSKEVINRGGEIISPIEVEEVFMKHPAIAAAAAFVVPHSTLQEAVGLMIVVKPGCVRPSKAQLQEWGHKHVGPPKWPVNIVYTPKLPLSSAGKMVRVGLAERLGLPENSNDTPDLHCHFEVVSIPDAKKVGNKAPIACRPLGLDAPAVEAAMRKAYPGLSDVVAVESEIRSGVSTLVVYAAPAEDLPPSNMVISKLVDVVHGYTLPSAVVGLASVPRDSATGAVDLSQLPDMEAIDYVPPRNEVETAIQHMWHQALGQESIGVHTDFFAIGGVSIQAGAVGYNIRKTYCIPANGALLYEKRTIAELAEYVDKHLLGQKGADGDVTASSGGLRGRYEYFDKMPSSSTTVSSTHWAVQTVHWATMSLVSLSTTFVLWVALLFMISALRQIIEVRIVAIVIAVAITKFGMSVYQPLLAIAVKWIVVGRFRPGRYPLWGAYYLRWWVANQFRRTCGYGVFGESPGGLRLYYRLMGAKIGKNVIIDPSAFLSEADLLDLGDDVVIDGQAILNPGVADCGDLLLSPISVSPGCCIGKKCVLAPGATLPKDTCMQPCSSSWELHLAAPKYRSICKPGSGSIPWWPLAPVGWLLTSLPTIVGLIPVMVMLYYRVDLILPTTDMGVSGIRDLLDWLLQVQWFMLYLVGKIFTACFSPFLELATVIAVKRTVFSGCFRLGPLPPRRSWAALARWWASCVLVGGTLRGVGPLINVHSRLHSAILRILGAKVGRHVFWPLSGLMTPYHDFIEVGDDVIWGASHALIVADDDGARPIVLEAGSNPLDRVVLSPGTRVCKNALVGTGSFVDPDVAVPAGSKYLGTKILEESEKRAKAPSTKPYGRACEGGAAYFHVPDWMWPLILIPVTAMATVFTKSTFLLALFVADACTRTFHQAPLDSPQSPQDVVLPDPKTPTFFDPPLALSASTSLFGLFNGEYDNTTEHVVASEVRHMVPLLEFFLVLAVVFVFIDYSVKMLGVWVNIAAKWAIIGRRQAGPHRFDKSSYSQRWHFYLSFRIFSSSILEQWVGTSMIPWYYRMLGSSIGKNVCFLQGAAPMLSREPDLTTIGDGVCINNSIIRCHSNALGIFELNPCVLGDRVTIRSGSVVQGGSKIEDDAILLERTLAMPGETINTRMAMQGWPADVMVPARVRMQAASEDKRNV